MNHRRAGFRHPRWRLDLVGNECRPYRRSISINVHIPIELIDLTFQGHRSAQKLPIECLRNLYL